MCESSQWRSRVRGEHPEGHICCSLFVRYRVYWDRERKPRILSASSLPRRRGVSGHPKGKKQFDNDMRIWIFIRNEGGDQFSATLDQIRTEAVTEVWIDQQRPNRPAARLS
jgi:hypothetical protein